MAAVQVQVDQNLRFTGLFWWVCAENGSFHSFNLFRSGVSCRNWSPSATLWAGLLPCCRVHPLRYRAHEDNGLKTLEVHPFQIQSPCIVWRSWRFSWSHHRVDPGYFSPKVLIPHFCPFNLGLSTLSACLGYLKEMDETEEEAAWHEAFEEASVCGLPLCFRFLIGTSLRCALIWCGRMLVVFPFFLIW